MRCSRCDVERAYRAFEAKRKRLEAAKLAVQETKIEEPVKEEAPAIVIEKPEPAKEIAEVEEPIKAEEPVKKYSFSFKKEKEEKKED